MTGFKLPCDVVSNILWCKYNIPSHKPCLHLKIIFPMKSEMLFNSNFIVFGTDRGLMPAHAKHTQIQNQYAQRGLRAAMASAQSDQIRGIPFRSINSQNL